jgi:hypothetical protein
VGGGNHGPAASALTPQVLALLRDFAEMSDNPEDLNRQDAEVAKAMIQIWQGKLPIELALSRYFDLGVLCVLAVHFSE